MALVLANRVQESATANTTVSFTLTGAVLGFQTFAVIGDTNTTFYSATDTAGNWEVGLGTYSSTGPTLTRTTIYASSNSGSAVTFSGTVNVFVTYPSGKSVNLDASNNVSALGTVSSGTWQGSTVGVAYGGTGVTASSGANSVVLRDASQNITANSITQAISVVTSAGGTTVLTVASPHFQILVGTSTQTFQLPDATLLPEGSSWIFDNDSTQNLTVTDGAGGPIDVVPPGGYSTVFLEADGTVAGTWARFGMIPSEVNWGTNSLDLGGSTVVTNGTWQGNAVQPAYGGTGLTTFVGANNALYSTGASTLTAGTLPAAAGGTGLTSYTANGIVYASSTSALATSSALVFNGTNVGVGATPAAWGTNWIALQFGQGGGIVGRTNNNSVYITSNTYFDGADYRYINTGFANYSRLFDGNYFFYSAPSGTAGDVASFNSVLEVEQDGTLRVPRGQIEVAETNATSKGAIAPLTTDASNGGLIFKTELAGVLAEKVRITEAGLVGIATTTPTAPLDVNGSVAVTGAARRITGDFSDATAANRVLFQSNVVNGATNVGVIPNGTSPIASTVLYSSTDPANSSNGQFQINATLVSLRSNSAGTGTTLPIAFFTGGTERMRVSTTGGIGFGGQNFGTAGQVLQSNGNAAAPTWVTALASTVTATTQAAKTADTTLATTAFVDRLRSLLTQTTASTGGTLVVGDRGTLVSVTAGVTVPINVFAANDVVTIYNNSAANITITQGASFTLRQVGTANTGNRTLAQRGIATVVFISATEAVISGGGLT